MAGMGRPGVEPLSEQRAWFVRLIAQGVSITDACRTLGVNRRAGTRWRFGRSVPIAAGSLANAPVIHKPVVVLSPGSCPPPSGRSSPTSTTGGRRFARLE